MREILSDIFTWPWFSQPHGYNFIALSLPLIPSGLEIEGSCRSWVYAYV